MSLVVQTTFYFLLTHIFNVFQNLNFLSRKFNVFQIKLAPLSIKFSDNVKLHVCWKVDIKQILADVWKYSSKWKFSLKLWLMVAIWLIKIFKINILLILNHNFTIFIDRLLDIMFFQVSAGKFIIKLFGISRVEMSQ